MLALYSLKNGHLDFCGEEGSGAKAPLPLDAQLLAEAAWIDLHEPTPDEERFVERELNINIPTREEIFGLEMANRINEENGAIYAPASILVASSGDAPTLVTVFFILAGTRLVTVRYNSIRSFEIFCVEAGKPGAPKYSDGVGIYIGLMELITDRLADVLGQEGASLDLMTQHVFQEEVRFRRARVKDFRRVLARLGRRGDMLSKARESMLSLMRVTTYFSTALEGAPHRKEARHRLQSIVSDIRALTDHVNYLSSRISLLLDATVGLINLEQNGIIKIFSVVSVAFLPPTLIASIYGMNFHRMPELGWPLGYPLAMALMTLSAVVPYLFFKRKGWL